MGDLTVWLIIFGVLALAFGPVVHLMPSKKDRRLAKLREEARRQGLVVELKPVRKLAAAAKERVTAGGRIRVPEHPSVCYSLPLGKALDAVQPWRLLKGPTGWVADEGLAPVSGLAAELLPLFNGLPHDAVAIDYHGHSVGCYWLERFPAGAEIVVGLKATLVEIGDQLASFNAQVLRETNSEPPKAARHPAITQATERVQGRSNPGGRT